MKKRVVVMLLLLCTLTGCEKDPSYGTTSLSDSNYSSEQLDDGNIAYNEDGEIINPRDSILDPNVVLDKDNDDNDNGNDLQRNENNVFEYGDKTQDYDGEPKYNYNHEKGYFFIDYDGVNFNTVAERMPYVLQKYMNKKLQYIELEDGISTKIGSKRYTYSEYKYSDKNILTKRLDYIGKIGNGEHRGTIEYDVDLKLDGSYTVSYMEHSYESAVYWTTEELYSSDNKLLHYETHHFSDSGEDFGIDEYTRKYNKDGNIVENIFAEYDKSGVQLNGFKSRYEYEKSEIEGGYLITQYEYDDYTGALVNKLEIYTEKTKNYNPNYEYAVASVAYHVDSDGIETIGLVKAFSNQFDGVPRLILCIYPLQECHTLEEMGRIDIYDTDKFNVSRSDSMSYEDCYLISHEENYIFGTGDFQYYRRKYYYTDK